MNELTKPIKGENQKIEPMIELRFQAIMGEYFIDCSENYEKQSIRKAYAMNDEKGLRKILESEY